MKEHICIICGDKASYNNRIKRWNKTCGKEECLHKARAYAQSIGVKNKSKITINKDDLYRLFIIENKTRKELAFMYNCSDSNIKKWLRKYKISKPQSQTLLNTFKTKLEKYGYSYYNNIEKTQITNIKNHGIICNLQLLGGECYKSQSKKEKQWLDELNITERQYVINTDKGIYKVDGYDKNTNTIYEYLGDYWHGNPLKYDSSALNKRLNVTMGDLYKTTIDRFNTLKNMGYKIIFRWESSNDDEEF